MKMHSVRAFLHDPHSFDRRDQLLRSKRFRDKLCEALRKRLRAVGMGGITTERNGPGWPSRVREKVVAGAVRQADVADKEIVAVCAEAIPRLNEALGDIDRVAAKFQQHLRGPCGVHVIFDEQYFHLMIDVWAEMVFRPQRGEIPFRPTHLGFYRFTITCELVALPHTMRAIYTPG